MERDIYRLIRERASCRAFRSEPIPEELMERLLDAACHSPSSGGFQGISIIKVTDPDKRRALAKLSRGQGFIATAPVSLVFCVDHHRMERVIAQEPAPFRLPDQFKNLVMGVVDVAVCAQTLVLAAEAEGLGSCYIGNILNTLDQVSSLLRLPQRVFPVIMLSLGWPKQAKRPQAPKYPAALLVHQDSYQERTDRELLSAYRKQNQWRKFKLSPQRLEACCALAERLHGAEYAARLRTYIEDKGGLSPYQYWFGCYYREEPDFLSNEGYLKYFEEQGFRWLEARGRGTKNEGS